MGTSIFICTQRNESSVLPVPVAGFSIRSALEIQRNPFLENSPRVLSWKCSILFWRTTLLFTEQKNIYVHK